VAVRAAGRPLSFGHGGQPHPPGAPDPEPPGADAGRCRGRARDGGSPVIDWYVLEGGALRRQPDPGAWPSDGMTLPGESWLDIRDEDPGRVAAALRPLGLHPLALQRCIAATGVPGAIS
jgi:hypothetical protein